MDKSDPQPSCERLRIDLPPEAEAEKPQAAELPSIIYFCPACAEREFG